ncbi:tail assembly protein, partial [Serratia marcescens]|uniref:tail assembly protein n=1 Tax=Serratia marcescens TaxID=615 RepID=UPI0021BD4D66
MSLIEVPLRTVRFHGPLINAFGREFKYRATTVPKAIDAMKNLLPGFERYMLEAHKRGLTFSIFVGKRNVGQDELEFTKGSEDIHLVPVVIGSKRAGLFQTVLGVALVAVAMYVSAGAGTGALGAFTAVGGSGIVGVAGGSPAPGGRALKDVPPIGGGGSGAGAG